MKLSNIVLLLSSTITLTSAAPAQETEVARELVNRCGDSTFINQSSGGSPGVDDCLRITENIANDGEWTTTTYGHRQLVQYGTCAFGVESTSDGDGLNFRVGNEDIISIIRDSVHKFQWNGLVGAKGSMTCVAMANAPMYVEWGIYHT